MIGVVVYILENDYDIFQIAFAHFIVKNNMDENIVSAEHDYHKR